MAQLDFILVFHFNIWLYSTHLREPPKSAFSLNLTFQGHKPESATGPLMYDFLLVFNSNIRPNFIPL